MRLERFAVHVMRNVHIVVSGREHLAGAGSSLGGTDAWWPRGSAHVVMSNHQSHYDVPVLYYVLGGRMRMVAKAELFAVPLFGQALRALGKVHVTIHPSIDEAPLKARSGARSDAKIARERRMAEGRTAIASAL